MQIERSFNTYQEAVDYLFSIPKFTSKSLPEQTRQFFEYLGTPGENRQIIHVAGTNGKGSVCTYIDALLSYKGLKTGVFTSPHLVSVCERFRIGKEYISEEEFLSVFCILCDKINEYDQYHPTFFEFMFFMAMIWFERRQVSYIILETGLGGRLDATNVIKKPAMTVITHIGLDHVEYLGETMAEIAAEKAGIIKPGCPLVFTDTSDEVTGILKKRAEKCGIDAFYVEKADIDAVKIHEKFIDFCITYGYHSGVYGRKCALRLPTCAFYQTQNAALAILSILHLGCIQISDEEIKEALKDTVWEGRLEEVSDDFFVDGAHNPDGIEAFLQTLARMNETDAVLIFGVNRDKDYAPMLRKLCDSGFFRCIILTGLNNKRTANPLELKKLITNCKDVNVLCTGHAREALLLARANCNHNRIYAVGSLYLVGEYKELIREESL